MRNWIIGSMFLLMFMGIFNLGAQTVLSDRNGVAVRGYDIVAYFTESKPVQGNPAISAVHEDATYHFSSQANLELFKADPERYLPAYGGYCAYAVSKGGYAGIQPHLWAVHDGRLFLNFSDRTQRVFTGDLERLVVRADANWPRIKARLDKK